MQLKPPASPVCLQVATNNFTEKHSTYESGHIVAQPQPLYNTHFNPTLVFGPSPSAVPLFVLTLDIANLEVRPGFTHVAAS